MGHGTKLSVGELSKQQDVSGFVNMLHDFVLPVTKQDGSLYPPTSLQNMLRALGRIICQQQEIRILQTLIVEAPFDIFRDVRYRKVFIAGTAAVKRSFRTGLGVRVKTSDLLTLQEELDVLSCKAADILTPGGCNSTVHWYLCKNFFIRGQDEICSTNVAQFKVLVEGGVEFLMYKPILSKTFKFTISNYVAHSLRKPVDCCDLKVLADWKSMMAHRLPTTIMDKKFPDVPHPVFLAPKMKGKKR